MHSWQHIWEIQSFSGAHRRLLQRQVLVDHCEVALLWRVVADFASKHAVPGRLVKLLPLGAVQYNLRVVAGHVRLERLLNIPGVHAVPATLQAVVLGARALRVHILVVAGAGRQLNHLLVCLDVEAQRSLLVASGLSLVLANEVLLWIRFLHCLRNFEVERGMLFGIAHCECGHALFRLVQLNIV